VCIVLIGIKVLIITGGDSSHPEVIILSPSTCSQLLENTAIVTNLQRYV